jgi:hypothetical protein
MGKGEYKVVLLSCDINNWAWTLPRMWLKLEKMAVHPFIRWIFHLSMLASKFFIYTTLCMIMYVGHTEGWSMGCIRRPILRHRDQYPQCLVSIRIWSSKAINGFEFTYVDQHSKIIEVDTLGSHDGSFTPVLSLCIWSQAANSPQ